MRNWLALSLLLLLIWALSPDTSAQGASWSADYIVSDGTTVERLHITATGAERQTLFTEQQTGVELADAVASDDGRYLAVVRRLEEPYLLLPLRIIDTQTGNSTDIAPLENTEAINFAGFEPNGTRVAFSYVGGGAPQDGGIPFSGGLMVVDAATGAITHNVPMSEAGAAINAPNFGVWAYMDDWTDQGILFTPNCYGCEGVFEDSLSSWNPDTGQFISDSGLDFSIFGVRLPATNEMLYWTRNTSFPYDPQVAYFPTPNVVEYHVTSNLETDGTVVHFDAGVGRVDHAYWVLDGTALLAESSTANTVWSVVYRDGQKQQFTSGSASAAQFGTPDGFVVLDTQPDGTTNILHYNLLNGNANILAQIPAFESYVLARSPQLWQDVPGAPQPFNELPELSAEEYAAIAAQLGLGCQGFLPSRLRIGEQARVTPGAANNMREGASPEAPFVGAIPGEGVFTVLDGPMCDPVNGIAWWYVDYQGTLGWTAEGQGDEYWTEPLE